MTASNPNADNQVYLEEAAIVASGATWTNFRQLITVQYAGDPSGETTYIATLDASVADVVLALDTLISTSTFPDLVAKAEAYNQFLKETWPDE